jgi:hypothetical protein
MCGFKVGDKVTVDNYEELEGKVGIVQKVEMYEDWDGDDETGRPIILRWYYLDIDFDGMIYNVKDWHCKKVNDDE